MPHLRLFFRLFLRPLRQEPLRASLTVLAVALGVAVVLAIELAGDAAAGSFQSSMETLAGSADFEVTATGGVPPEIVARLATLPYPLTIRPRIEDYAEIAGRNRTVPFLGVDMLTEALPGEPASTRASAPTSRNDIATFQRDDSVWLSNRLGYKTGDRIQLIVNDRIFAVTVRGLLSNRVGEAVVMDLAPATRLLSRHGLLDRILIQTPPDRSLEDWERILRNALPPGVIVARQGAHTSENRRMLAAFRWNLRVLSYIALVVGAFLIYNTISVSVVRRRNEIGILRALGATRASVLAAFLGEAAWFGLLGSIVGIALGRFLAGFAVQLVAATVEALYVSSRPGPISLTGDTVLLAILSGLCISVTSALPPAWEASLVTPVDAMARGRREHQARVHRTRSLAFAALFAAAAWLAARQPPVDAKPLFGYLAALLLIAASALAIPALVSGLCLVLAATLSRLFGVEALLATRSLAGSLRRTSVLVGALATAIAMLTAVGIMVGSFRQTVLVWMDDRLQADLYLRPAVPVAPDRHPTISASIADRLARLPEVAAVDRFRAYEISYRGLPATLGAGEARIIGRYGRHPFLSGASPPAVFHRLLDRDNVIVSEPFANKHHVHAGDILKLRLAGHLVAFHVVDVYYDYSNERGFIVMDRGTLLKYLPDPAPSNIAVYLKSGVPLDQGRRAVEAALAGRKVLVSSNRSLREEGIRIFDRTFAITYALEAVAVIVAVMGVAGALLALVIDHRREFGLLRFLGCARDQLRRLILFEAGLLALLANVAGFVLGILLSLLLIYVINKQSFGWTIQFHWPVAVLLGAFLIVDIATIVAGLYPARVATQLVPIEVIPEE
ncbi:MAG TPA: FtsX-like permease family protein [Bryobacteraceae bacterium]|nr:FtsX-like permease family protein [Bryobacteraceae bacterium]